MCWCSSHHKGSRPLLDITMQSQIPHDSLFMGCACLVQHGCYSVLDTNMAAALFTHAAVFFSCHAVQQALSTCHTVYDSGGVRLCCCIHTKYKQAFIKMLVVLALTCLPSCWRSMDLLNWLLAASSSAWQGHFLTLLPLTWKWKDDTLVWDSLFLCACLLKVYNCVHAFQLYIQLSGSLFIIKG